MRKVGEGCNRGPSSAVSTGETKDNGPRALLELAAAGTSLGGICECAGARADIGDAVGQSFAWIWGWANDQLLVSP